MNMTKTATAIALGALFSAAAFAQPAGYGGRGGQGGPGAPVVAIAQPGADLERRDAINNERIERGIREGQITRREAARLREQQARIERMEARARADGVVTERERVRIEVAQKELSRNIRFEKHDRQARY
jgi:hypothetical protein